MSLIIKMKCVNTYHVRQYALDALASGGGESRNEMSIIFWLCASAALIIGLQAKHK